MKPQIRFDYDPSIPDQASVSLDDSSFRFFRTAGGWQCSRHHSGLPMKITPGSQSGRILGLLLSRFGEWVPLPAILALSPRIAQYNYCIKALRGNGYGIDNKTEFVEGEMHSFFKLHVLPAKTLAMASAKDTISA